TFRLNRGAHSTLSSFAVKRCFEVFLKLLFAKHLQPQQLTACLVAFNAARRRIIRGLISESTPCSEKTFDRHPAAARQLFDAVAAL
ncbi:hypothetical protein AAUI01_25515, partial [Pseudomonas mosselii]|uniref:hypothetical protein n=1 Tax=Pseudomonas mosselii TaxID=78327 RepID=UPI0032E3792F